MRADRLVATLLVLQSKGRVTARELAEELEVSVKTARRDLEALSMAGVPVYSQPGRNGGWMLLGGSRTNLTGLTAAESRALFLAAGAATPTSPGLKEALRKLAQAVPEPFRADASAAAEAVIVDEGRWGSTGRPGPSATDKNNQTAPPGPGSVSTSTTLDLLQQAVIDRQQLRLGYDTPGKGLSQRLIHPLGLVVKASIWYLIAQTANGQRTFRVDRITSATLTGEPAIRPDDFDLKKAWSEIQVAYLEQAAKITGTGLAEPWTLKILRDMFADGLVVEAEESDGRIRVSFTDYSIESLASRTAGIAAGFEIIDPPEARTRCREIGKSLLARYDR